MLNGFIYAYQCLVVIMIAKWSFPIQGQYILKHQLVVVEEEEQTGGEHCSLHTLFMGFPEGSRKWNAKLDSSQTYR